MLKSQEKQELRELSKEILGSETAYLRLTRGVVIRQTDNSGRPMYTETGIAISRKVTKAPEDILAELRQIKQKRIKDQLAELTGKA